MVLSPFMVLSPLWYYLHLWYYPPYFFCKVNANERNGKEILSFYLLRSMISIIFLPSSNHLYIFFHAIFISSFMPSLYLSSCHLYIYLPSLSEVVFTTSLHPHQEPAATFAPFSYIKTGQRAGSKPLAATFFIYQIREIILYISLPKIKSSFIYQIQEIILYPRARNRHHSIYFLGTKVSQVWSS